MLGTILRRTLMIATIWGLPVTAASTLQRLYINRATPRLHHWSGLKVPQEDRLPAATRAPAAAQTSLGGNWVGSLEQGRFEATYPDNAWFVPGSAELSREGNDAVLKIHAEIKGFQNTPGMRITVEAHTDSRPVVRMKHRYSSNWELSGARAFAVVRALIDLGLSPSQLSGTGLADSRPLRFSNEPSRRIAIKLSFDPVQSPAVEVAQR